MTTVKPLKIGTDRWWKREFIHGRHGIIHAVMNLVFGHKITDRKGVEMVEQLMKRARGGPIPPAPWEDVQW